MKTLILAAIGCSLLFHGADSSGSMAPTTQTRTLTFADRVAYQHAIEEVYWRHRDWPGADGSSKPSLDQVMSQTQMEKKVEDYLRNSQALEDYWQQPITPKQLQAEMDRMATQSKRPGVLRELFAALGNDPYVIAECLARPALADRLARSLYAHDQRFHDALKQQAQAELAERSMLQMQQTSGQYTEMAWVRADDSKTRPEDGSNVSDAGTLRLTSREWSKSIDKLAAQFRSATQAPARSQVQRPNADPWTEIPQGVVGSLQEDDDSYYATAVLKKGKDQLKVATVTWLKQPFESLQAEAEPQVRTGPAISAADYTLPAVPECIDDTWTATSTTNGAERRLYHTAVWTGSRMIVWGGEGDSDYLDTGGRYDPATDSWTATSTSNAPSGRYLHTAVWTGSEMIVWGGYSNITGYVNTGGRYDPATDNWTATSTSNAPSGRYLHTAVWTGSEMIVWGGYSNNPGYVNTGGRYDPVTNSWTATSTSNAPEARESHTAVWTGSRMIVWGGYGDITGYVNTGGRYDPATDSWTATSTSNAPSGRSSHTAVWTGSEMIVWGGSSYITGYVNTGGRYDPVTNSWTATSTSNAPERRSSHTAVWTGSRMIVWGGSSNITGITGYVNTGGRYDPVTNSWTATSTSNAPEGRSFHTAVWTGSRMIVWGGFFEDVHPHNLDTGGRYDPVTNSWTATSTTNAPERRSLHTAVWTGSRMIVWGGFGNGFPVTGGRYDPVTNSWTATSTSNAPEGRESHTAVWTGSEMIVWGGYSYNPEYPNTGGRYDPATDSWTATSTSNAPSGRSSHTAVWTGSEMIVWGGSSNAGYANTGGRYDPVTNSWTATSTSNAPEARESHTAVWTGSRMIVWGGFFYNDYLNTGGRYDPVTDSWTATSTSNAPSGRSSHTAVWTGSRMIVWGGFFYDVNYHNLNTGGRYDPVTNSWTATSTSNAPERRSSHTAVWTGSEMIVWGGSSNTGGRYDPATDSWTATSTTNAPERRYWHTAVWTGSRMIVWGGYGDPGDLDTGGRYCVGTPSVTPTPTPTPRPRPITITVQTNPAGLSYAVDGTSYTVAKSFSWLAGSTHILSTTSPQNSGGQQYIWQSWSDNGAISHTIAPTTPTAYTAFFRRQ